MRKKMLSYLIIFIFFIPAFIFICYAYEGNVNEISGIYYQVSEGNIKGKYIILFDSNKVYVGLIGDEKKDIINDIHNLNGSNLNIQGKDYTIKDNKIIINKSSDSNIEFSIEGSKIIIGDGDIKEICTNSNNGPSLCTTSIDGTYKK
jgi:hypothetical protein